MACNHKNPPGVAFCVVCGCSRPHQRCDRCGAVCDERFLYCGQCGFALADQVQPTQRALVSGSNTYDLATLMGAVGKKDEVAKIESKSKASQDDIKALLAAKKKGK